MTCFDRKDQTKCLVQIGVLYARGVGSLQIMLFYIALLQWRYGVDCSKLQELIEFDLQRWRTCWLYRLKFLGDFLKVEHFGTLLASLWLDHWVGKERKDFWG